MSYAHRIGDLFESDEQAIAHGCNCRGVMGAGVARLVASHYSSRMLADYKRCCADGLFKPGDIMPWSEPGSPLLYNLATQDLPGPYAEPVAIFRAINQMLRHADTLGIERIGMPRIGAGIGGLDWDRLDLGIYWIAEGWRGLLTVYVLERDLDLDTKPVV